MPHMHRPREYEEIYYAQNGAFWGQQGRLSSRSENGLQE